MAIECANMAKSNNATIEEIRRLDLEVKIRKIEKEITLLRQIIQEDKKASIQKIKYQLNENEIDYKHVEINDLLMKLEINENWSGIIYSEYNVQQISHVVRKFSWLQSITVNRLHTLQGSASEIKFGIQFVLKETKLNDRIDREVVDLKIGLEDNVDNAFLEFLVLCQETCSLHSAIRGLSEFGILRSEREKCFASFQKSYSNLVTLPDGSLGKELKISSKFGFSLIVNWNIRLHPFEKTKSEVYLNTQFLHFNQNVLNEIGALAADFRKMAMKLGIKTAIANLIEYIAEFEKQKNT